VLSHLKSMVSDVDELAEHGSLSLETDSAELTLAEPPTGEPPTGERPTAVERPTAGEPLTGEPPTSDELLLEGFIGARKRARGPLVAISNRTMITNSGASEILEPGDRRMLWDWVRSIQSDERTVVGSFALNNGIKVTARCRLITENGSPAGAVMSLALDTVRPATRHVRITSLESVQPQSYEPLDPILMRGWVELTDAERTVAEHVSRGLTNKEAGRQMYLSRHTVDSHLRQVFRKLGINSRVELARLLGEHYEAMNERSAERCEVVDSA